MDQQLPLPNEQNTEPVPQNAGSTPALYEVSGRGEEKQKSCVKEFSALLVATAMIFMRRRDSNTLDESDFANSYRHLLASQSKDWIREVVAALVILFGGGGVLAVGVNFLFGENTRWYGVGTCALGLLIGGLGFLFQHYPFRSR